MKVRKHKLLQLAESVVVSPSPGTSAVEGRRRTDVVATPAIAQGWGWMPALSLVCACGVALVALAFTRSSVGADGAELLYWIGLMVIFMPITARLISAAPSRRERIALVVLLGLALYLVKVMLSPFAFTFPDEMKQIYNTKEILQTGHLFHKNFSLPVTALYPGLSTTASALASLSGLSVFSTGLILMGVVRLVFVLALYLLHEQISGSARVAGIATAIYMGNPNYLYWIAEFSYEALALPLAVMLLFALAWRDDVLDRTTRLGLTLVGLLALMAVVITHHMTSYAVVGFLGAVSVVYRLVARGKQPGVSGLALIALVATLSWLIYVASLTVDYLSPVFSRALISLIGTITREETGRALFQSSSGYVSPLWERAAGLGSVLLLLLGLPFGLLEVWRRYRGHPFALILAGGALTYFAMLGLRFIPAAWETSNRSSEFLFVGLSFVEALGIVRLRRPRRDGRIGRGIGPWIARPPAWIGHLFFAVCAAVIFAGGAISGWTPSLRLARPYLVAADTHVVEPQGVSTAKWVRDYLGPGRRIAADRSNGELLLAYGEQEPLSGSVFGILPMLLSPQIDRGVLEILHNSHTQYVVVDRRVVSRETMLGIFWNRVSSDPNVENALLDPEVYTKFDRTKHVSRIFDSGNIAIYDVRVLSAVTPTQ